MNLDICFLGIFLGMKPNKIEIMPYGFSISFKTLVKDYNKKIKNASLIELKKIIVAISGPAINILIMVYTILHKSFLSNEIVIYSNLTIAIFNLLPIYPLDGGRVLKSLIHIFFGGMTATILINRVSYVATLLITLIGSIAVYYFENIAIFIIIVFLWLLRIKENKKYKIMMNAYKLIKVV